VDARDLVDDARESRRHRGVGVDDGAGPEPFIDAEVKPDLRGRLELAIDDPAAQVDNGHRLRLE
jgi:hypothetical protein